MELNKSSRHSKITGDFGESIILYWLSKYGFECALVDHTGIDIIARNPHTNEIMGISVKSRSRDIGRETDYINIPNENFDKAEAACQAFGCVPYLAIVVDAGDTIYSFLLSMQYALKLFQKGKLAAGWKMTPKYVEQYLNDPQIVSFIFKTKTKNWWNEKKK